MKISFITPTFNSAACIRKCLDSVASQVNATVEHVIIDGLSSDNTQEIVENAQKIYPHIVFVSEKDKGIYDAMNKGLRLSTGDYIMFLGSDDCLFDNLIIDSVFKQRSTGRCDVIYGNVLAVGDGLEGVKDGSRYDGEFDLNKLLKRNICHQAIFYSRKIVERVGEYNLAYSYCSDWDYNLRSFRLGNFEYVDRIIARYNTEGLSTRRVDFTFQTAYFDLVKEYFGISVFDRRFKELGHQISYLGFVKLKRDHDLRGLAYLIAGFKHDPTAWKMFSKLFSKRLLKTERRLIKN